MKPFTLSTNYTWPSSSSAFLLIWFLTAMLSRVSHCAFTNNKSRYEAHSRWGNTTTTMSKSRLKFPMEIEKTILLVTQWPTYAAVWTLCALSIVQIDQHQTNPLNHCLLNESENLIRKRVEPQKNMLCTLGRCGPTNWTNWCLKKVHWYLSSSR